MFRKEENRKLCEDILREIAEKHGIGIMEIFVMPDHLHLIVDIPPTMSRSFSPSEGCIVLQTVQEEAKLQKEIPPRALLEPREVLQ
jgi:hypothetical protein